MADLTDLLPKRSVEDILAERIRVSVGGREFILPSLNIEDTEAWLASLEGEVRGLLGSVDESEDIGTILASLSSRQSRLVEFLVSYDKTGLLPPTDELRRQMTPMGLIRAVLEVWRAANPLVDIALTGLTGNLTAVVSPPPTSSPRRNGTSRRVKSGVS